MPFFGASRQAEPEPVPEPEPTTRKGLFHSRREPEPAPVTHDVPQKKHSLFNRRTSSPSPPPAGRASLSSTSSAGHHSRPGKTGSLLSKFGGNNDVDPSIQAARERVMGAEQAEAEADRALGAARLRVREAREQVKLLEEEAREDARRAKIKQHQAGEISKRGKGLGRKYIRCTPKRTIVLTNPQVMAKKVLFSMERPANMVYWRLGRLLRI